MARDPARTGSSMRKTLKPPTSPAKRAIIGILVDPSERTGVALLHRCVLIDHPPRT